MKILLAEDDSNIAAIAKMVLEKIGGHQVTHVANGQLAVEQSQAEKFDLILLDEMMPKLNGLGAFNKIKELDNNHPPVIFLSAKSQNDEIDKLKLAGIGFIGKPFDPNQLCQMIDQLLQKRGS